jgi:hypothetical protein
MRIGWTPVLLLAALSGCNAYDPFTREGAWRPSGLNERNLAQMAVRPQERVEGTGATGAQGQSAVGALDRLRADRVKPLPDSGIARIISIPSGSGGN